MGKKKWIQGALKPSTKGAFTKQAKSAGKGVQEYANEVLRSGSRASTRTKRRANLARTLKRFHR